jgi:hypothetical protein
VHLSASRGSRGTRVLAAAALLTLTTACGPVAIGGDTVSPDSASYTVDATGRRIPQADREVPAAEAAPESTSAVATPPVVVPVVPGGAPEDVPGTAAVPKASTRTPRAAGSSTATARAAQPTGRRNAGGGTTGDSRSGRGRGSGSGSTPVPGSGPAAGSPTAGPTPAAGAAGPLTNRTASFSAAGYTADYRVFAEGIDVAKPVGLLVYADGTGEYGLENPTSSYAIGGSTGLAAVARAHNMVLLTPFSPNRSCKCWEQGDAAGYATYLATLIAQLHGQYGNGRLWFAGYSSGAQAATRFLFPAHPDLWSGGGGVIAIGGGGAPASRAASVPAQVKSSVVLRWNTGASDTGSGGYDALSGPYGAQAGQRWYAGQGFDTAIVVPPGVGHDRSGQFGRIVDGFLG